MKKTILCALCAISGGLCLSATQYSKLAIILAAKQVGKWDTVKSWITQAGYSDEWHAAAFFSDAYPEFATITNAVVASGIATSAEIEAILAAAKDTAPDALLGAVYLADMQTVSGRAKWHGGNPNVGHRTNETTRIIEAVETYPDGYVFVDPAKRRKYLTPEEEAERYQARNEQSANTLETRITALRTQIAELELQRANGTNDLEMAHAIIQLAAKRKTLARLEARQTNTVTVIIGAQH